jgi:hypothetical protein
MNKNMPDPELDSFRPLDDHLHPILLPDRLANLQHLGHAIPLLIRRNDIAFENSYVGGELSLYDRAEPVGVEGGGPRRGEDEESGGDGEEGRGGGGVVGHAIVVAVSD